jgi:histidinol phosphatase-like enzyme (inositol monophosphatase family)
MIESDVLNAVEEVARLCGDAALRHFRTDIAVELKNDGSEVTRADREAESIARDWIGRRFPNDGILGEEFGREPKPGARRWIIDPIDGTRSFVRGVPLWGSLVALEENGVVVAGAINCPATGDFLVAARGHGCWHNGSRTSVSATGTLATATILTTDSRFRTHPKRFEKWTALGAQVANVRAWGDCYGYVLVATGRAELMVDDRMSPWDVAALIPVVEEAGGVFTDWQGRLGIGPDAIASNATLARPFRDALGVPPADT